MFTKKQGLTDWLNTYLSEEGLTSKERRAREDFALQMVATLVDPEPGSSTMRLERRVQEVESRIVFALDNLENVKRQALRLSASIRGEDNTDDADEELRRAARISSPTPRMSD